MQKTLSDHQYQLDDKASKADLAALEARLMALINGLNTGGGNNVSDSELVGLKKKCNNLEKTLKRVYDAVAEL